MKTTFVIEDTFNKSEVEGQIPLCIFSYKHKFKQKEGGKKAYFKIFFDDEHGLDKKTILKYIKFLNISGFPIHLRDKTKDSVIAEFLPEDYLSIAHFMGGFTNLRYLFIKAKKDIALEALKIKEELPKVTSFKCLQLAHTKSLSDYYGSGLCADALHMFIPYKPSNLISKEEYLEGIKTSDNTVVLGKKGNVSESWDKANKEISKNLKEYFKKVNKNGTENKKK